MERGLFSSTFTSSCLPIESGILRRNLLALRKESIPGVETDPFRLRTAVYKHYIFIFDQHTRKAEDCIVFDTQKGTTYSLNTGMLLKQRSGFSFCHWKDNIFVLYGGVLSSGSGLFKNERYDVDVHFLKVIEKDGQISFEVESCGLKDREWWNTEHSAEIYQDNMYVFDERTQDDREKLILKKFDLNTRAWSRCETTGDIPRLIKNPVTALFEDKVYFIGSLKEGTGTGGPFGGGPQHLNDLLVLNLEKMNWLKTHSDNFLPKGTPQRDLKAQLVGDKIYISQQTLNEFIIYNPTNNQLSRTQDLPPLDGWTIKSFGDHVIVFKISNVPGKPWIEYQDLAISSRPQPQKEEKKVATTDSLVTTSSQLSHMELLWKEKPFADVTFAVQNEEIPAHRVILLKCRYFQNMFNSGMIEANSKEINVPDIAPINFKAILEYIYCDKINLTESLAMELIILADMYFLPDLKADCENYLSAKLTVENFVRVVKVAETADSEKLEKKVVSFLTSNIEKVKQEVDIHIIPPELFIKAIMELKSNKK